MKYTISGHETFACRYFWLKKGIDFHEHGHSFGDEAAVVHLGVGKNMVTSIRFWMKAFGFFNEEDTALLKQIFNDDGFDPFLEDVNTLWLLHYQIVKLQEASIYSLFFNDFNPRTEFSLETFEFFLKRKFEEVGFDYSFNSLENDLKVFKSMYLKPKKPKNSLEDEYSGLFQDLNLFDEITHDLFYINSSSWKSISPYIVLYVIMERYPNQLSISFSDLLNEDNSIGKVFCLNQSSLYSIIEILINTFDFLNFTEDAGIRELQIKQNPFNNGFSVLKEYYDVD